MRLSARLFVVDADDRLPLLDCTDPADGRLDFHLRRLAVPLSVTGATRPTRPAEVEVGSSGLSAS